MFFHIWSGVSGYGGHLGMRDKGNKKPEPWRSFSMDSIWNLKIRFLSCHLPLHCSPTRASCNHIEAACVRTCFFNLINPNTVFRESLTTGSSVTQTHDFSLSINSSSAGRNELIQGQCEGQTECRVRTSKLLQVPVVVICMLQSYSTLRLDQSEQSWTQLGTQLCSDWSRNKIFARSYQ